MKIKYPVYIMVFGGVMPPFIFPRNMEDNIKWLVEVVLPWIKGVAAGWPYVRHQDSALYLTQSWLSENFCNHFTLNIWLPNSTDYLWYAVEWETNKTLFNTKDELKARIMAAFANLNKAFKRFQSHLEAMFEDNSNFFE